MWCVQTRVKDGFWPEGVCSQIGGKRQVCTSWFCCFKMMPWPGQVCQGAVREIQNSWTKVLRALTHEPEALSLLCSLNHRCSHLPSSLWQVFGFPLVIWVSPSYVPWPYFLSCPSLPQAQQGLPSSNSLLRLFQKNGSLPHVL